MFAFFCYYLEKKLFWGHLVHVYSIEENAIRLRVLKSECICTRDAQSYNYSKCDLLTALYAQWEKTDITEIIKTDFL